MAIDVNNVKTLLQNSIEHDDVEQLEMCLYQLDPNVPLELVGYWNFTPLLYACRLGSKTVLNYLISNFETLDYNSEDEYGHNALLNAVHSSDPTILRLMSAYISPDKIDKNGNNCLHIAASIGSVEMTRVCIEELGIDQTKNAYGMTPLHLASNAEIVEMLILNGADVNEKDNWGWTPLHYAAYNQCYDCARVLIQIGADVSIADNDNTTAFDICLIVDDQRNIAKLITEELERKAKRRFLQAKEIESENELKSDDSDIKSNDIFEENNVASEEIEDDVMSLDLSAEKSGGVQENEVTGEEFHIIQLAKSEIFSEAEEKSIEKEKNGKDEDLHIEILKQSILVRTSSSESSHSPFTLEVKNLISGMLSKKFSIDFGDLGVDIINYQEIKMREELGKGGYGKVYRAYFRDSEVAVKIVNSEKIDAKVVEDFIKEIQSLIKIRHHKFLLLLGICIEGPLCIVTELAKGGNLADAIEKNKFDHSEKLKIALQIAEGMNYIHNKKPPIVHRDLKPQNILLDQFNQVKIGDLGLSRTIEQVANTNSIENTQICQGTIRYMAPELYEDHPACSTKTDIWAYGCVLYQLFTGLQPWSGLDLLGVQRRLVLKYPFEVSEEMPEPLKELILKCCTVDPISRPRFKEIRLNLYAIMGIQPSQLS
ncbi:unnamed protein product [Blepharisma stoltei]|uniref:Protein kinase domain-containing protein n=1 Tax=Blepharisma stoltei TaxID=1481888 RepID=A0AAU9J4I5_9CILI|nr:unnamed protein product [Blepharisma stoltei]